MKRNGRWVTGRESEGTSVDPRHPAFVEIHALQPRMERRVEIVLNPLGPT